MPSGPMHEHATDLRQLVSTALSLSAVGSWKAVCVPHGVRFTFLDASSCASALKEVRRSGFEVAVLSSGANDAALKFVVTGWDGKALRARQAELEAELRLLRAEVAQLQRSGSAHAPRAS